jgi:hypothetical protein
MADEDSRLLLTKLPDPETLGPRHDNIGQHVKHARETRGVPPGSMPEIYEEYRVAYDAARHVMSAVVRGDSVSLANINALGQGVQFWRDALQGSYHRESVYEERAQALEAIKALAEKTRPASSVTVDPSEEPSRGTGQSGGHSPGG